MPANLMGGSIGYNFQRRFRFDAKSDHLATGFWLFQLKACSYGLEVDPPGPLQLNESCSI